MESKNFTAAVFCSRLKSARIKAKLSQTELADRVGRPQTRISSYETGRTMPDAQTLADICRVIGVSADWLLFGTEAEEKQEAKKEINGGDWADYMLRLVENPPTQSIFEDDLDGGFQKIPAPIVYLENRVSPNETVEMYDNIKSPCATLEFYGEKAAAFFKEICVLNLVKDNLMPEQIGTLRQHACDTAASIFVPDELPF